ncbi:MAG: UDP-N-acetylmuramoyl-L-alanyl-D-glutamate--2,6-diaminopimelate ligase [Clostridia bacterium]|mgnify:CR=1 FL=1|jgi:UDP-N-acetylmuramoyl-L-alanyl-D-glutamate--2,6-diaminopimelate ligase|nr:UDP-N-acetylmuramoyl-L-alanyl-D-glutamate--2,6-diaminopimelate ligase [Clostridia bacterium]
MLLKDLIENLKVNNIIGEIGNKNIENITINSKEKEDNALFIAQKGLDFDGHNFVREATRNGAVAIVVEREIPEREIGGQVGNGIGKKEKPTQIIVEDSRLACADIASTFYGNPKNKLTFAGITGTNGKTSTSFFLAEMLKQAGKKTAIIGSLGVLWDGGHLPSDLTTPDPIILHKTLAQLVNCGVENIVMEVSAHALALKKVDNIKFKVGILTNITQDHLDFFKTMDSYADTKLNWFSRKNMEFAVVNADDNYAKLLRENGSGLCTLYYGIYSPSDTFATSIKKSPAKTEFALNLLDNILLCDVNLSGEFNVYNTISAATAALCLGAKVDDIEKSIRNLKAPIGRFNVVDVGKKRTAVVDFAHTPDSLEKVLETARGICRGRMISVFGCGGDRDRLKRPIMGAISEKLADFTVLTSDNPRFENPETIINDIEKGMKGDNYIKIADRKKAIAHVLSKLSPDDVAVFAGKGGELYQDIDGVKIPYSDFEEIEKFKKKLNKTYESSHNIFTR